MRTLAAFLLDGAMLFSAAVAFGQEAPAAPCKALLDAPPVDKKWSPKPLCTPSPYESANFLSAVVRLRTDAVHLNAWLERPESALDWHEHASAAALDLALAGSSRENESDPGRYFYHAGMLALASLPKTGSAADAATSDERRDRAVRTLCDGAKQAYDWMSFAHYCRAPNRNNLPKPPELQRLEESIRDHCVPVEELRRSDKCYNDWYAATGGERSLVKQRAIAEVVKDVAPDAPVAQALSNTEGSLKTYVATVFDRKEPDAAKRAEAQRAALEHYRTAEKDFGDLATNRLLQLKPKDTATPETKKFISAVTSASREPSGAQRLDKLYTVTAQKPGSVPPSLKVSPKPGVR